MDDTLDGDELAACFALRGASERLKQVVAAQLRPHRLSEVQFSVLATLHSATLPVRMGDLATWLVVSKGGLTYQVAQLEDRGLVERITAEDDERSVIAPDLRGIGAGRPGAPRTPRRRAQLLPRSARRGRGPPPG